MPAGAPDRPAQYARAVRERAVQHRRSHVYRPYSRHRRIGVGWRRRMRPGGDDDRLRRFAGRRGRGAADEHQNGGGGRGRGAQDTFQLLCDALHFRPRADGGDHPAAPPHAAVFRRQRRYIALCGRVFSLLHDGNGLCAARHGNEFLCHRAGLCAQGDVFRAAGRGDEHRARSGLYFPRGDGCGWA